MVLSDTGRRRIILSVFPRPVDRLFPVPVQDRFERLPDNPGSGTGGHPILMNRLISLSQRMLIQILILPVSRFSLVLFLAITGAFSAPSYADGPDDEKYGLSPAPARIFGGIIVHLQKTVSFGEEQILLDRTPMISKEVPLCWKPSGKVVPVLAGKNFRHHREPSSFVVIPDSSDPLPRKLAVGDCITVEGNVVDRIPLAPSSAENRIRIDPSVSLKKKGVGIVRAFSLKLWHPDKRKPRSSDRSKTGLDKNVHYE